MTRRHFAMHGSVLLLLVGALISVRLTAAVDHTYPIKDSKFPAAEAKLGWIDDRRVIFHGYEIGKVGQPSPDDGHLLKETGLFIWDTQNDTVTKYWDIDGQVPLCVFRGRVFFSKKLRRNENAWLLVSGPLGNEEQKVVSDSVSVNGHSCHVSDHRPTWMKDDKHRRLPLLEEHGYLDFGIPSRADPSKASSILLYPSNKNQSLQLPFTGEQVRLHTMYFDFDNSYLLEGQINTTYAAPVWKLKPDGTVTTVLQPVGQAWEQMGWGHYHFTRKGLFLIGGRGDYGSVGTTGGYLLSAGKPGRVIAGLVKNAVVSNDGCKVAFVHVLHSLAGAESARALRQGKTGTRTVKMIDLCKGDQ